MTDVEPASASKGPSSAKSAAIGEFAVNGLGTIGRKEPTSDAPRAEAVQLVSTRQTKFVPKISAIEPGASLASPVREFATRVMSGGSCAGKPALAQKRVSH